LVRYDVAVSYAQERRPYVAEVVKRLYQLDLKVFYDQDPTCQALLFGEDMTVQLDNIYRKGSHYCVMFICKNYAQQPWTKYEQLVLRARRFSESKVTVLPCRFDDTELPGLQPTIGFVDLNNTTPTSLATLIYTKIRGNRSFNFRPFYTKHAMGDYQDAATYLEALFQKHYKGATPKKRIWLTYNLACSYSRLAGNSNDTQAGDKAIQFFDLWLENIVKNGVRFYLKVWSR
jgi:hypothetical protein